MKAVQKIHELAAARFKRNLVARFADKLSAASQDHNERITR
jgi:aromatic ring-opening dioxygenase LigB subunit